MKMTGYLSATVVGLALAFGVSSGAQAAWITPTTVYWADTDNDVNDPSREDPSNVDVAGDGKFLSIGYHDWAVFDFGREFVPTTDGVVIETTYTCNDTNGDGRCNNWPESVDVYAIADWDSTGFDDTDPLTGGTTGADWFFITDIPNADAQGGAMFSVTEPFRFLALVDTSDKQQDGFDVDYIAVAPLPAAAWFLLTAIGGLFGGRWLKGRKGATA
ncbi:VPLPA-CTERM sorting domain-containing protein [uncultured Rhodospira sp.]|uniref:VPLPA-CTERM sorting domain-containing protein n=1 Tax=uncultured Rhodospira sp. TaxID=1936189 RepID=UPI0026242F03|nr:VPLPA-CTERM sorting domain-containing protein [uncultured Rhodospira sp.]